MDLVFQRGFCSNPRNCKNHDLPAKMYRPCPTQICGEFRNKIFAAHRFGSPSWKNTRANLWCTSPWEMAKSFMPTEGYQDVTSFTDTDFNGIVNLMINCTEFQQSLSTSLSTNSNLLTKAREIGRKIRHSPELKVSDADVLDYFDTLISLLSDPTKLLADSDAKLAVSNLKLLRADSLPISSEDVREILQEARAVVETGKLEINSAVADGKDAIETGKRKIENAVASGKDDIETGKKEIKNAVASGKDAIETGISEMKNAVADGKDAIKTGKLEINNVVVNVKDTIETEKSEIKNAVADGKDAIETGKSEIENAVASGKDDIETGKKEIKIAVASGKDDIETGKKEIENAVASGKGVIETGMKEIKNAVASGKDAIETGKDEIKGAVAECIDQLPTMAFQMFDQALQKTKERENCAESQKEEDLRQRLAKLYLKTLSSAPFSPLVSDNDEMLDKFYVPPEIIEKTHRKVGSIEDENCGTPVNSYRQLFCPNGRNVSNIYMVGEAGMGKSFFTSKCALLWAGNISPDASKDKSKKHRFNAELLFKDTDYLSTFEYLFRLTLRDSLDDCNLTHMIKDQLIDSIYSIHESEDAFKTALKVLSTKQCVIIVDGLDEWSHPRNLKCPCKEEDKVVPFLPPTIDATVLITSRPWRMSKYRVKDSRIDKYLEIKGVADIWLLISHVIDTLHEPPISLIFFHKFVKERRIEDLLQVPIMLMMIVSLWYEGKENTFSICDIYAQLVDMLLGKHSYHNQIAHSQTTSNANKKLPSCFRDKDNVLKYFNIVLSLARLAFERLFTTNRKQSLVFDKVECFNKEELLFLLKSGILREQKSQSLIRTLSKFSFLHKSVQEFLAAVNLSYHPEEIHRVKELSRRNDLTQTDIQPIFLYLCGMNCNLANEMSELLCNAMPCIDVESNNPRTYKYEVYRPDTSSVLNLQSTIMNGLKTLSNSSEDMNLCLYYFNITRCDDISIAPFKTLLSMNKSSVRYLAIEDGNEVCSAELLEVFTLSRHNLTAVSLYRCFGQYDISECHCLKYLYIRGKETKCINVNTCSLISCLIINVLPLVECNILKSISMQAKHLKHISLTGLTEMGVELFYEALPKLLELEYIYFANIKLLDMPIVLPISVRICELYRVEMVEKTLREWVEWIEGDVEYCRLTQCHVVPSIEIAQLQHSIKLSKFKHICTRPEGSLLSCNLVFSKDRFWTVHNLFQSKAPTHLLRAVSY
ncbi:uncharacterized protein LOC128202836 isoform X2 [Mya arenaria]|uniref:uncharacterized protein LOC128202836 isoform X2 n=1 Tax=Mya arenaria TaxID=6604 RepID=UPI0022E5AEE2|nr:uncharacterized protein LOC128202836 isoform X2 [Mya arenaria]